MKLNPVPINKDDGMPEADILLDFKNDVSGVIKEVNRVLGAKGIKHKFVEYNTESDYYAFDLKESK